MISWASPLSKPGVATSDGQRNTALRVLVVGGSGYVGGLTLPILARHHHIRIFDLEPPPNGPWEYCPGDLADRDRLQCAAKDIDALLFMAIGKTDGVGSFNGAAAAATSFDVSVKGLYFALDAARKAGCNHAVYTSSMSVYHGKVGERYLNSEDIPPDPRDAYGLTKNLGEEVCRFAVRSWEMSVNVLRLCLPVSMERWNANDEDLPPHVTASEDVARALLAALEYRNGFEVFTISGDRNHIYTNFAKAKRLLGWQPLSRPIRQTHKNSVARSLVKFVDRAKRTLS